MLNCKQVATLASEYLDSQASNSLNWKIRMHLLMCSHCRRFIRHLKITQTVTHSVLSDKTHEDVDVILQIIKKQKSK